MYPRWLVTLDEDLEPLPVTVRVGQVRVTVQSCLDSVVEVFLIVENFHFRL